MTESSREPVIPYDLYRDLIGRSFEDVGRCFGLAVEVCRRMGMQVSGALDDLFETVQEPAAGDLVMLELPEAPGQPADPGKPHVAVYLGGGRVLHALRSGVAVTPLRASVKAGVVRGYLRWAGRYRPPLVTPQASDVTVVYCPEATKPFRRQIVTVPHVPGKPVSAYAPEGATMTLIQRRPVFLEVAADLPVEPGAILVFARLPAGTAALIALGIGIVLSFLSTLFLPALPAKEKQEPSSPTFDIRGLQNTALVGIAQPIVYGEHRVGGNLLHAFQRADANGKAILHMMVFLSRGPIDAIAGLTADFDELQGEDIPDDIEINGSPAKEYGAIISGRLGSNNQDTIPGFSDTVTAKPFDVNLLPSQPFTHETDEDVNGFDVNIEFPKGCFNLDLSNGGTVGPRPVGFAIRWRPLGTTTWSTANHYTNIGRRSLSLSTFRMTGLTLDRYEIQVERFAQGVSTPNGPSSPSPEVDSDKESQSVLTSINQVTSDGLTYPNKALLAVRVAGSDQLSGGQVVLTAKIKGRKVWVWDGVSEAAPNFGTVQVYSDNPAWCVLDLLQNPQYGLARNGKITLNNIALAEFEAWADLCDTSVSDGRGGMAKRATLDLVIDTVQPGWELVHSICAAAWARLLFAGNEIRIVLEAPSAPVAILGMGQLADVVFSYKGRRARPNVVEVQYVNEEANFEEDLQVWPPGGELPAGEAIVKETLRAVGCTRPYQAARLAHFRWNFHNLSVRTFAGRAGVETIHLLPGDVAEVQHDSTKPGTAQSGRVLAAAASTVTLDHDLTITSGTNKIKVRTDGTGTDVLQERTLTNGTYPRGTPITVTAAWDGGDVPVRGDPYVAGPVSSYFREYRIVSLDTNPATLERSIIGYEYSDDIFDDDPGEVEESTDLIPSPHRIPEAVTDLKLSEAQIVSGDGSVQDVIRVEFNRSERWHGAVVWYRVRHPDYPEGIPEWECGAKVAGDVAHIGPFGKGAIVDVAVTALSTTGARGSPDRAPQETIVPIGYHRKPAAPLAVVAEVTNSILHLRITPPTNTRDVAGYQIRYGDTWAGSMVIARFIQATEYTGPITFVHTHTIRVRSVSRSGVVSSDEATYTLVEVNVATSVYTITTTQLETLWTGTATDTVVDAGSLVIDGTALTGEYEPAALTGSGNPQRALFEVTAGLKPVERLMSECAFRLSDPEAEAPMNASYLTAFEITPGLTMEELGGIPMDGLVGTCLLMSGEPIDIVAALEPTVSVDTGAGFVTSIGSERDDATIQPKLTLNRPHSRYVPRALAMAERLYDYA